MKHINMTKWRPIKTAPKDGNSILVAYKFPIWMEKPFVSVVWWNEYTNSWEDELFNIAEQPTHWMPFPKPPK